MENVQESKDWRIALFLQSSISNSDWYKLKNTNEQAGTELGQAQLKLELELSFTWFKFCCIKLIDLNTTGYFDYH